LTGFSFVLLIVSLAGFMARLVVNRTTVILGQYSYSIYIVHFVVLDVYHAVVFKMKMDALRSPEAIVLLFPLVVACALGVAWLTKRFIEDPGIALGHRISARLAEGRLTKA
jgi:peptidoglycan/LPS O-acetylase OafA/YrhL